MFLLFLFSLAVLVPGKVWAEGYFDIYGVGSRCIGMGGACTAIADDSTAVYYNPGAIPESENLNIEFFAITNFINLNLDLGGDWGQLERLRSLSVDELEKRYANVDELEHVGFSAVMPIVEDAAGENLFSFGLMFSFGVEYCIRFLFIEPADPFFLEYSNYVNKLNMIFAGGVNISGVVDKVFDLEIPGISVGAGINGFFDGAGGMFIGPPARFNLQMPIDMAPVAGVLVKPFEGFYSDVLESIKLGISYSKTMSMEFALTMGMVGMSGDTSGYDLFHIGQLGFGFGIVPVKKLTVGYELTRYAWSDFKPPFFVVSGDLGAISTPFEFEQLNDVWANRIGAEYEPLHFLKLQAGYFYRPSAVPDQVFLPSAIDLDTHALSLGATVRISDAFSIGLHSQYRILAERTMEKSSTTSLTASGNVWNTGLTLIYNGNPLK